MTIKPDEPLRRKLLHLVRFGGLAVIGLLVLTACYTDVAVQPTATVASLAAVTNVPPTQPSNVKPPTQPAEVKPPPTKAGGGGGNQQQPQNDGGGGGASPEAATNTPIPTRTILRASPVTTPVRTPVAPPTGSKTPIRTGITPVVPATKAPPVRTVLPAATGTMRTTQAVTPSASGTKSSGVTPPPGVTVSPTKTATEMTGSPTATGMLIVTKHENFENAIIPGACFALLTGDTTVASACDGGDGDKNSAEGKIGLEAPPGAYTLHETTPPQGYMPAADMQVELVAGTPTEIDVIDHLIATTEASPSATSETEVTPSATTETEASPSATTGEGVLIASIAVEDGSAPPDNTCLTLSGPGTYQACDNHDGDQDPTLGTIEIDSVMAGDYTLTATPPDGYELVEAPPSVTIPASNYAQLSLTLRVAATPTTESGTPVEEPTVETETPTEETTTETETPTEEATPETETETPTEEPTTEATPAQVGYVLATFVQDDGTTPIGGACLQLTGPATYNVCDDQDGDQETTTPGTIEIDGVPIGDYTVAVQPPAGYEPAAEFPPTVHIDPDQGSQLTFTYRLVPTTGTVRIDKFDADGATPLGGACFELTGDGGTYQVCDDAENDADESVGPDASPGVIVITNVVAGDYTVHESQTPEGHVAGPDQTVHVDAGQMASVSVTNGTPTPPETGTLTVHTVDPDGNAVPGACYTTTLPDGSQPQNCDDDGDGTVTFDALPPGDYTVTESTVPPDYQATDVTEQTVTVPAGQTTEINFTVQKPQPTTGTLVVTKIQAGEATPSLGGACFTVTGADGNPVEQCDDDGDGTIRFENLAPGDYTVHESRSPENYLAAEDQTATITAGAETALTFADQAAPTTGTLTVTKVDAADGTTPLGGACFAVTGADGTPVEQCDDDNDGTTRFDALAPGDYTVHESRTPDNYLAAADQTASVAAGAEATLTFADQAAPQTGTLVVTKVDAADGTTTLAGACFAVTGSDGTPVELCDDDGDGVTRFENVLPGDYTVHESHAPDNYLAAEDQTASITAGAETPLTFADQAAPQTGTLAITKVNAADGTSPLGGACFTATGADATPTPLCDDDGDGSTRFENLAPGDYTVSETRAPDGYLAAPDQPASVTAGAETPLTFADQAAPQTGSLTVVTINPEGTAIPGACYTATGPNETTAQGCDDDNDGTVPLGDVAAGDWQVQQTTPPPGYDLPDPATQTVTVVAGQPMQVSFTNQPTALQAGSLAIAVQDDQGQPVPGACFDLTGPQAVHACDDGENDADPATPGRLLVQNLPPGDYAVTESQPPAGYGGAEAQTVTVAAAPEPAPLPFVNAKQPAGVALPSPVVYTDDAGRLWLLRPNDTQPTRLDSDDRRFDPSMDPVFSSDHTWVAFLVTDATTPAANMVWVKLDDLTYGPAIDFSSIGTPRRLAWLPGHTDTLIVAAELATGGSNVFYYRTDTSELPVTLFPTDQPPATIDAIVPAPTGSLVAIQTTGTDGDTDTYIVNTADPAAPVTTQVGPNTGNDPDHFLAWNPAGDRLLMQSGTDTPLLYIADAGGTTTPLGTAPLFLGDPNLGTAPQWSADGGWIAAFDGDPAAGGQLHLFDGAGTSPCDPIPNVIAVDWSPTETRLWALVAPPNEQVRLTTIGTDCAQQDVTTFDTGIDNLLWSPNGAALALIDHGDAGTTVSLLIGDQLTPIDPAPVGLAITDVLSWSPGGELLALYAGGPTVSLWVVTPGSATPTAVSGSTLPEGANYVTKVWWG